MATGSTVDFVLSRNDLIMSALRKIKGVPEDGNLSVHKFREAVRALNLMLRAESLKRVGMEQALWAKATFYLPLTAKRFIYDDTSDSLPQMIELQSAFYRNTNGDDEKLDIYTQDMYETVSNKGDTSGAPEGVYLRKDRLLKPTLYLWPTFSTISTSSDTVVQDDYTWTCIKKHTSGSGTEDKPGTGASAPLYWKQGAQTLTADTWAASTSYANGPLLVLNYTRPLYDFDSQYDNPDIPIGWEDYLIYKLALRLAPEYDVGAESRQMLRQELALIEVDLWPSERQNTDQSHNKVVFF